jgi:hypothetical protein
MSTKFLQYWVGEHFVPALSYDDPTGLSDDEESALSRFFCGIGDELGNWYEEITDESDEMGLCEVTGLRGPVVKVRFYPVQPF